MATEHGRGSVAIDTDVYSSRLIPDSTLARRYDPPLVGRAEFVSFQTGAEADPAHAASRADLTADLHDTLADLPIRSLTVDAPA